MANDRGYLLPAGDAFEEDLQCIILFYPDRAEYRQALFGSLDYLGTWIAWERDAEKRGKDAALSWKIANELTRECLEMNTCETIIDLLTQIRDNQCDCIAVAPGTVTYNENIVVVNNYTPWIGTPPSSWADQAVSSWDEWAEYVCGAAHSYVDDLKDSVSRLCTAATIGGYALDFIAHVYSVLNWRYILDIIPVNWDLLHTIVDALGEGLIALDCEAIITGIESSREDIVCALINGTSLEDAVESAIDNTILWNGFFQFLDYETTTSAIYKGEVDNVGYIPVIWRDDCLCDSPWGCENSLLMDCSFESAGSGGHWVDVGHTPSYPTDAYEGTYCWLMGGTGSGWCASQYTYQELTAPQTGNLKLRFYVKRYQGVYTTKLYLDKWNGSSWVEQRQYTYDDGSSWHISDDNAAVAVSEGDLLRVRICNGAYFKLDRLWLFYV